MNSNKEVAQSVFLAIIFLALFLGIVFSFICNNKRRPVLREVERYTKKRSREDAEEIEKRKKK